MTLDHAIGVRIPTSQFTSFVIPPNMDLIKLLKAWIWSWINFTLAHAPLRLRSLMRIVPAVVPIDYPGVSIVVHSPTDYYVRRISAAKEPFTVKWIEAMKAGDVLYDVGANVGTYSLIAAKHHRGKVRIYAFEPGYANYAALCDNLKINAASGEITAFPVALGETTGTATFFYSDVTAAASGHTLGEAVDYKQQPFAPAFSHQVLTWTLDEFIQQYRLPWPTHLKIDVDGTEFGIFRGAPKTLERLQHLIVELNERDSQFQEVLAFLKNYGLSMTYRHEPFELGPTPHPGVCNFHFSKTSS